MRTLRLLLIEVKRIADGLDRVVALWERPDTSTRDALEIQKRIEATVTANWQEYHRQAAEQAERSKAHIEECRQVHQRLLSDAGKAEETIQ